MKRSAKVKSKTKKFEPGEHIRVVPLHHPKPAVSIEELREREEGDLFDGKPHVAPASAKLTYRGGALLKNVAVFTIFWGKLWGSNKTSIKLIANINKFFAAIVASPAIDQLAEYSVPSQAIGHGSFVGTKVIRAKAPVHSPKIVSIMGGSRSCQSYCGYHDNVGKVYYAVMPYPTCDGCLGGKQVFDALTGTTTHELCEAITDAVPGAGWYDDNNGEIGDICAWNFKQVAGYNVQLEWSNNANKCV